MPQANKDNASGKNKPNWVDKGTLAVLTLTLLAVAYYATVTRGMWQEMIKATEATKKSADVAAAATKPWIATTTWKFIGIENSKFKINIGLKNVGQTAAVNVKAGFGFALIKRTPSRPRMDKQNCPPVKEAPGIVMPNVDLDNDVRSQIFTEYDFKSFKDGATVLYIIGCVEYEDVLGNKDRITKFARFYPPFFGEGFTIDPDNTEIR